MEFLPAELLVRVLCAGLPVADLVRCRAVCRRWRHVLRALAERDAAYAVGCSVDRDRAHTALLAPAALPAARANPAHGDADDSKLKLIYETILQVRPCTCGREGTWRALAPASSYLAGHGTPNPPLRWEAAAAERALADALAARACRVLRFVDVLHPHYHDRPGGLLEGWLPAWRELTAVHDDAWPATTEHMRAFVREMLSQRSSFTPDEAGGLFADPTRAAARYQEVHSEMQQYLWRPGSIQQAQYAAEDAHVADVALARGGAVAVSLARCGSDMITQALGTYPVNEAPDPDAHSAFVADWCEGDPALADAWEGVVREADATLGPAAEDPLELLDHEWMPPAAWAQVPLPEVFRFPATASAAGDDRAVHDRFKALCEYAHRLLPLFRGTQIKLKYQHRMDGWPVQQLHARQAAAAWRLCCGLGWSDWLRRRVDPRIRWAPLLRLDDHAMQVFLDDQVAAADAMQEFLVAHFRLPALVKVVDSVYIESSSRAYFLGGISPTGHLVGALTADWVVHEFEQLL